MQDRIKNAIHYAVQYGGIAGDHHKSWVIDQMVRALTGCPVVTRQAVDAKGRAYSYEEQSESDEYTELVAKACEGVDGPETYSWDCGITP